MSWGRSRRDEVQTALEAFESLKLDDLRPMGKLISEDAPQRKTELVPFLVKAMTDAGRVQALYNRLDQSSQNAVRMAVFDPEGELDPERFEARFGERLNFSTSTPGRSEWSLSYSEQRKVKPTLLRLFFPHYSHLTTDTWLILKQFVPPLETFTIPTRDAPPDTLTRKEKVWDGTKYENVEEAIPIQVRETALPAEAELRTTLRLVEAGKVRVTDKKLMPTDATRKVVADVLTGGDFYAPDEWENDSHDPASDLAVRAFAWPALVQAGGLAEKSGGALKLTAAGKRALTVPAPDVLRKLWSAWIKTRLFDEFARIEVIKGQGGARMSAAAGRREVLVEALRQCPVGKWCSVENFFRLLRATGGPFEVARDQYKLYVAELHYGNFGNDSLRAWEQLQGRFAMAFLFEYAATLGVIDVAYVPPQGARKDFKDRWGADNLSCLSRYDGLLYLRVNPLGAWILGQVDKYHPAAPTRVEMLRLLPNLDVVAARDLPASDRLVIERFSEPASEGVWKLSVGKILGVVEQGGNLDELEQFLTTKTTGELPGTVAAFLADLRAKAGRLTDAGPARLIACADEHVAAELAADRQLKGKCLRAGDRFVVVRDADLETVRKAARKLGYVWPVPGD